jgi:hypothetical protein
MSFRVSCQIRNSGLFCFEYKYFERQRTQNESRHKVKLMKVIRKMVAVYCKNRKKPTNTPCGNSEENLLFLTKWYKSKFVS